MDHPRNGFKLNYVDRTPDAGCLTQINGNLNLKATNYRIGDDIVYHEDDGQDDDKNDDNDDAEYGHDDDNENDIDDA